MARVTIGIPAYNGESTIREAIECVISQSFDDFELVISDNASTDGTEEICREAAGRDNRIVYIRHEQNLGATANYNFVANKARTEYFKWHSCNDLMSSNVLQSCVSILDSRPEVVLTFPKTFLFEDRPENAKAYDLDPIADQEAPSERFFYTVNKMALCNIMNGVLRLDALHKTGMLREFFYADRSLMAELALVGKFVEDPDSQFFRRMDATSATHLKSEDEVLKHFDPNWKRPLSFSNWRVVGSFVHGIWASNIGVRESLKGTLKLARWAWWKKRDLAGDVSEFARCTAYDLKQKIFGAGNAG